MTRPETHRGACLCGGVVFEVDAPLRPVTTCHCTQCRKQSGHFWAATSVPHDRFRLIRDTGLRWFHASDSARRGHCGQCGAFLFWEPAGEARISFAAGALEGTTGLTIAERWFTEDGGDYDPEASAPPQALPERLPASCLCGDCRFDLPAPAGPVTACHCLQCRVLSGHFSASFDADPDSLRWQSRLSERVFTTPGGASRGFCATCGSKLWFRAADGRFSVEAGVVDGPTGGRLARHIHVASKGDYYTIGDGLPQHAKDAPDA